MRVEQAAASHGIGVAWRAFLLGPIFETQGWRDSPFNIYPSKGRYMWRDMERLCRADELEFQRPSQFPRNGLLAARITCAFEDEAWIAEFVRRIYVANFALDLDIADADVVAACLEFLDLDAIRILDMAHTPATKTKLREQTATASARGIFGAPSFTFQGELFWGNERLDSAIAWAAS